MDDHIDDASLASTETYENKIQSIVITKDQLEYLVNDDIPDDEWNTFAYDSGCGMRYIDHVLNGVVCNLIDQFVNTGEWPVHTLGNLFLWGNPSFEELETFLMKYNIILTDEIWNEFYHDSDESDED